VRDALIDAVGHLVALRLLSQLAVHAASDALRGAAVAGVAFAMRKAPELTWPPRQRTQLLRLPGTVVQRAHPELVGLTSSSLHPYRNYDLRYEPVRERSKRTRLRGVQLIARHSHFSTT
jgi:hypothetical protein